MTDRRDRAQVPQVVFASDALLLDIDGTLLDIAAEPDMVQVPDWLPGVLGALRDGFGGAAAFVSGRRIADIDRLFAPLRLPTVGVHGAEIRLAAGAGPVAHPIAPLPIAMRQALAEIGLRHRGVLVEDKDYAVALHYRNALDQANALREYLARYLSANGTPAAQMLQGKFLLEIKSKDANKATGVRALMAEPPFAGRRAVFLGDDTTDEDVFAALPDIKGIGIGVGRRIDGAVWTFDSPGDVRQWLQRIANAR